ncbi:hypothetical protein THII_1795 [Thioploca ingrica]|uniref:Chemoreceptor zinc-binding domain-containing protein n=1 Tax=Thioploca ingrica TaxID=40754 RepID=A0A090AKD1_9GAMM|nr:hypothetical protein THII_1795 [Thioploca ingrica]
MKEVLQKAITTHSHWKYNLQQAIKTGKSPTTVDEVKNAHRCELGKWLDSAAGKALPGYAEINKIHQDFHEEAADILKLALAGKQSEAQIRMQLGSYFGQLTAKLVNKLSDLETSDKV